MNSTTAIPFTIDIPSSAVDDLRARLANTRWPEPLPGHPWQRGVPVGYVKELANYWLHGFDWPKQQTLLNRLPQFTTLVDGQTLHFLHIRSRERNARPLLLIHGWPGSFVEFLDLVGPLTDPRAHGGEPSDAFDLVIPSVPGHGFSRPLSGPGWTHGRCAAAYAQLMARLGYQHYGVHGGDVGAFQAPEVGRADGEHVIGIHVNALVTFPPSDPAATEGLTPSELERLARLRDFGRNGNGYLQIQATRPMSLAYGLQDSPAGQLAWIAEKFKEWATNEVDRDRILTNVSLYWFTGTAGSSANLYYETYHDDSIWRPRPPGTVPTAVLVSLTQDVAIRRFAEQAHRVVRWTETDRGGHFMALEAPEVLVDDLRQFFREMA